MKQDLAHDLRGYLQLIMSCAQLIQMESEGAPSAGHAELILQGALDMERALSQDVRPPVRCRGLDPVGTVRALCDRARPFAMEKGVELAFSGEAVTPFPEPELLSRAALNLITNAVYHTPPGGRVAVRVEAGENLSLTVTDTGCGVRGDLAPHLFDEGVSDSGGGTGLSVVREFAERTGGAITFRNLPGGGACFTLSVPYIGK